jgi:MFS superfamily sulfate permease-like transporter
LVIVSVKALFLHFHDVEEAFWINKKDALVWVVTFAIVIAVDAHYGLLAGLAISFVNLLLATFFSEHQRLGSIPGTELFADVTTNKAASFHEQFSLQE